MCKHKQALIDGNVEMLFDPNQAALLSEIRSWPQFKNLQKHFETFSKQLTEIEKTNANWTKRKNKSKQNSPKD